MGGVSESQSRESVPRRRVRNSRSTPNLGQACPDRNSGFGEAACQEHDPDLHLEFESSPRRPWTGFHGPCIQLASIDFCAEAKRSVWTLAAEDDWSALSPEVDRIDVKPLARGCSSAGRAPDLHSGGRRFDPDQLHQWQPLRCRMAAKGVLVRLCP